MTASLIRGDSVHIPLRDESVDLVVTSPPYFALRSYQDGGEHYDGQIGSEPTPQAFLEALWAVTAECKRVLKPSGSMFVNLGDKYAGSGGHNNSGISDKSTLSGNGHHGGVGAAGPNKIKATRRTGPDRYNQDSGGIPAKSLMLLPERYRIGAVDHLGLIARAVVIWDKPNGLPESVTDRVRRSHEDWVHLTKQPRYYAAVDEIREQYADRYTERVDRYSGTHTDREARDYAKGDRKDSGNAKGILGMFTGLNPLGKLPGSVWRIPTNPLEELWQAIATGEIRFCPKCGRDLTAGNGPATPIRLVTAEPSAPTAPNSTSTASPTSSGSAPSPTGSPSTTSAATDAAATPPTSKPSPDGSTSSAAASPSKPTASTGTPSLTPISTDEPMAAPAGSAVRVRSTDSCVCGSLAVNAPGSVWTVPSEPLRVPEWVGVDHYAAYPQELPRRLILGWTPPGYCTECGQARTAVVDRERVGGMIRTAVDTTAIGAGRTPSGHMAPGAHSKFKTEATITGYRCACPTPDAPTRPAVVLDPFSGTGTTVMVARALGRYCVGIDLSADYHRLATWRIWQSGHAAKTNQRTWAERQETLL